MSFAKILERNGKSVSLISVTKSFSRGKVSEAESETSVKAIVEPLKSAEKIYLNNLGVMQAEMNLYVSADNTVNTGDVFEIDGERYEVKSVEKFDDYAITESRHVKVIIGRTA